ncbi:hypothetical protein OnM2_c6570o5 [Erysiphe neolycopersici]|uniref:Uncharacterized protein n=1 Tax=Erysiphe neolycopersici TaxID=212602 RepID=A0A420HJC6_9PEZI|nr:hypothetical protein OnM2_c6570o5 [Erysiphe neolycopersici]
MLIIELYSMWLLFSPTCCFSTDYHTKAKASLILLIFLRFSELQRS